MLPIAAVVLTDSTRTRFDGVDLNERAAHIAHRAGIFNVHFAGNAAPSDEVLERLRAAGWPVTVSVQVARPLSEAPPARTIVVLPACTIIEPAALVELLHGVGRDAASPALIVTPDQRRRNHVLRVADGRVASVIGDGNATSTGVAVIPSESLERVRGVWDYGDVIHRLAKTGTLRAVTAAPRFCATLDRTSDVAAIEREYQRRTGRSEGLWAASQSVMARTRTMLRDLSATAGRLRLAQEGAR
jgi:hypothetical protein